MLIPIRKTMQLSRGAVTLRAWGARVADANLQDLFTLCATLGHLREEWQDYTRQDTSEAVWGAFWRLVQASLEQGSELPDGVTWNDRLVLLETMWELNDIEEAEGKVQALSQKAANLFKKAREQTQGQTMTA